MALRQVVWTQPAVEDLAKLDKSVARRISMSIERYATSGVGDVKKLQGIDPPALRLRVGDYRIRFRQDADTLYILNIRNRKEAYR